MARTLSIEAKRLVKLLENPDDWSYWQKKDEYFLVDLNIDVLMHKKASLTVSLQGFLFKKVAISILNYNSDYSPSTTKLFNRYDNKIIKRFMKRIVRRFKVEEKARELDPFKNMLKEHAPINDCEGCECLQNTNLS